MPDEGRRIIACSAATCGKKFDIPARDGKYACPACGRVVNIEVRDDQISEQINKA